MAAIYADEEEVWKCKRHSSRRRRTGICHVCLRERLSALCPECANVSPCACNISSSSFTDKESSSASTSSSSFSSVLSRFTSYATGNSSRMGSVGNDSSVVQPSFFIRSRSVAVPSSRLNSENIPSRSSTPLWSIFKSGSGNRSKRVEAEREKAILPPLAENGNGFPSDEDGRRRMMSKSRSVAVTTGSDLVDVTERSGRHKSGLRGLGWPLPSPMKALKNTIPRSGTIRERPTMQKS